MISATSSRVIISLSFSDKDRTTASGFYDVADRLVTFQLPLVAFLLKLGRVDCLHVPDVPDHIRNLPRRGGGRCQDRCCWPYHGHPGRLRDASSSGPHNRYGHCLWPPCGQHLIPSPSPQLPCHLPLRLPPSGVGCLGCTSLNISHLPKLRAPH